MMPKTMATNDYLPENASRMSWRASFTSVRTYIGTILIFRRDAIPCPDI